MKTRLHLLAGLIATTCIVTFWTSTALVEIFGSTQAIAQVKHLIVFPGLFILVPCIAATGASGFSLATKRKGNLVQSKKKRMPIIAGNGILILVPAAIFLNHWASQGLLDTRFYLVQALELLAGIVNLSLMGMNIRDGLRLSGRFRASSPLESH